MAGGYRGFSGVGLDSGDESFIVRGQRVVDGAVDEHFSQPEEIGVDVCLAREGYFRQLVVCAFAETDANSIGEKLLDVGLRTIEIGLNDNADRTTQAGAGVDAAHDVERDLSKARVLHVDADEALRGARVLGEVFGDGFGQLG